MKSTFIVAGAVCAVVLGGVFAFSSKTNGPSRFETLMVGLDTSGSDREYLPEAVRATGKSATDLPDDAGWLTIFSVNSACREVWNAQTPRGFEEFSQELLTRLSKPATEPNTRFDLFWSAVRQKASIAKGDIAVLLITDGIADGVTAAGHKRIREDAAELAKNPRVVRVTVLITTGGDMDEVQRDLLPLASKLQVMPFTNDVVMNMELFPKVGGAK